MKKQTNKEKHNFFSIIILLLSGVFLLGGCGGGNSGGSGGGTASVSISFSIPSSANSVAVQSVPIVVASIAIEISASDMATITNTFDVSPGSTVNRNYDVPIGQDRTFSARAYSGSMGTGNLLYLGETTLDISGESAEVVIHMVLSDIFEALRVLNSGDIVGARDLFRAAVLKYAVEGSNNEDTANFFYALTRVFALWFDIQSDGIDDGLNDAGDILDAFGCSQAGRDPVDFDVDTLCPDILPSDSPTGQELQDFLYNVVRPELIGAIANLDAVSQSFNIAWTEPFGSTTVESDYGDVLFFRAVFKGAMAVILIQYAYDLNADIDVEFNAGSTVEEFLNNNLNFLTLTDPGYLNTAKGYLTGSALDDLDAAIVWMDQTETDSQDDDLINLGDMTSTEIAEARDDIATARQCLDGQCTPDDNDTPSDTSDDTIIDLSPFFAGIDLRSLLPAFVGDGPTGLLPDPTFGGMLFQVEGYDPGVLNTDTDDDGTADIFENPTQLTTDPADDVIPGWSPDGTKILFRSDRSGDNDIWVMDADGTNLTQLTSDAGDNSRPNWSSDGTRIVFHSDRSQNNDIYIMDADGSNLTQLTTDLASDSEPDLSPDGTKVVFTSDRFGNNEIFVMNIDGSGLTQLTNVSSRDGFPDFSPDGSTIVFRSERTGNSEIWVMNSDGTGQTQLTNTQWTRNGHPHFSPDGSKIVFWSERTGDREVWTMNSDGSWQTQITNNPANDGGASWSPDGTRLVFRSDRSGDNDIWVYFILIRGIVEDLED